MIADNVSIARGNVSVAKNPNSILAGKKIIKLMNRKIKVKLISILNLI
jgi:hypothetical protein